MQGTWCLATPSRPERSVRGPKRVHSRAKHGGLSPNRRVPICTPAEIPEDQASAELREMNVNRNGGQPPRYYYGGDESRGDDRGWTVQGRAESSLPAPVKQAGAGSYGNRQLSHRDGRRLLRFQLRFDQLH